jgi:hypothetical protein
MVGFYIAEKRRRALAELKNFRDQPFEAAVHRAALARDPDGKRFGHQRRLKRPELRKAEGILSESLGKLRHSKSFAALHELIIVLLEGVSGLGELYYYDTALRIGANLNKMPQRVYLHRGTREGARALGLDWRADSIDPSMVPKELGVLEPHEMEDFLCIFKDDLRSAVRLRKQ